MDFTNAIGGGGAAVKRRIMVVVDQGREASGALQWALSHAVLENDDLILLHVEQIGSSSSSLRKANTISSYFRKGSTSTSGNNTSHHVAAGSASFGPSAPSIWASKAAATIVESDDFLEGMRAQCETAQPTVRVQIERVEMVGKDKAPAILAQSKLHGVQLLVIGQPRRSTSLFSKLGGGTANKDCTAEFLIENSKCLCVGVQKKGQNAGYLLNTKTHKNFWLLA